LLYTYLLLKKDFLVTVSLVIDSLEISGRNDCCPLCASSAVGFFHKDDRREFLRCEECKLIFVPPYYHLTPEAEKAQYDLHRNSPEDSGYRRFLARLFDVLEPRLPRHACGLDFGCGPGPTLSLMFEEKGHSVALYDIYYAPSSTVWDRSYDFITSTEVVEHLFSPGDVLDRLWRVVREGGWLGIMTKLAGDRQRFAVWHYRNDPTHVCFFSEMTFLWLARKWGVTAEFFGNDVILFRKELS